jgi:hypothetical protein
MASNPNPIPIPIPSPNPYPYPNPDLREQLRHEHGVGEHGGEREGVEEPVPHAEAGRAQRPIALEGMVGQQCVHFRVVALPTSASCTPSPPYAPAPRHHPTPLHPLTTP